MRATATFVFALTKLEKFPRINRWIYFSETYFFIEKKYAKNPKNSFRDFMMMIFLIQVKNKMNHVKTGK